MAPKTNDDASADGDGAAPPSHRTLIKESTKISQPEPKKRVQKNALTTPNKKRKASAQKNTTLPKRRNTKKQQQIDQAYERLVKERKIFGQNSRKSSTSNNVSGDTEHGEQVQDYISTLSGVEGDLEKGEQAMIDAAWKRCGEQADPESPPNGPFYIWDIKTPLAPIQFATLGWMIQREARNGFGKGGIVAHDMGMGKTLMVLALLVVNRTTLERRKGNDCATLVVVPSDAVIDHWQAECKRHVPAVFPPNSLARYKDLKRARSVDAFKTYKIVFITYGELAREVPHGYKEQKSPDKPLESDVEEMIKKHRWPAIFQAMWYRVVLDEAHTMKNRTTKCSLSVRRLQKRSAWAVTGTPLSNGRDEMYPYFNFLNMEKSKYASEFSNIYFPDKVAAPGFRKAMTDAMIRRRIGESFLGERIISLPNHHASTETLFPSPKEMAILKFIQVKIQAKAKKSIKESINNAETETVAISKAMASITSLLHFYRYAGVHLFLVEDALMRKFSVKDLEKLIQELSEVEDDADKISEAKDPNFLSIDKILNIALHQRSFGKATCSGCKKQCVRLRERIYKLPCEHYSCFKCFSEKLARNKLKIKCRAKGCSCIVDWGTLNVYSTLYHPGLVENDDDSDSDPESEDEQSESDDEQDAKPKEEKQKTKLGPGCDIHEKEPQLAPSKRRFLACMDQFTKRSKTVLPSAKILHVQELLRKWQLDAPDDKVIVFTQFMVVAHLVGRIARLENIPFLYYTGDLSYGARKSALDRFKSDDSVKLMITSLKCGGQALDISRANRVILMELWWNSPAEEQAFGRVYRMGQEKEVHVVRLKCEGTREDDIAEMQALKDKELRDCLMSKKMTKSNHTLHSIYSLIGIPITDKKGIVIGLKRPDGTDYSESSDGSEEEESVETEEDEGDEEMSDGGGEEEEDTMAKTEGERSGDRDEASGKEEVEKEKRNEAQQESGEGILKDKEEDEVEKNDGKGEDGDSTIMDESEKTAKKNAKEVRKEKETEKRTEKGEEGHGKQDGKAGEEGIKNADGDSTGEVVEKTGKMMDKDGDAPEVGKEVGSGKETEKEEEGPEKQDGDVDGENDEKDEDGDTMME